MQHAAVKIENMIMAGVEMVEAKERTHILRSLDPP